jgi:hypothetical protein
MGCGIEEGKAYCAIDHPLHWKEVVHWQVLSHPRLMWMDAEPSGPKMQHQQVKVSITSLHLNSQMRLDLTMIKLHPYYAISLTLYCNHVWTGGSIELDVSESDSVV